jgi:hypothetical protein
MHSLQIALASYVQVSFVVKGHEVDISSSASPQTLYIESSVITERYTTGPCCSYTQDFPKAERRG